MSTIKMENFEYIDSHRIKTYWIRDYRGAKTGKWFAYCWTHKKASIRCLRENTALELLNCHESTNRIP